MKVLLETARLVLRQFTLADVDNLFALDSDRAVMRFINGGTPTDYEVIKERSLPKWLAYYEKYEHYGLWASIEKSSKDFIGWFHFYPAIENTFAVELNLVTDNEIALGYRLCQSSWGKGYATEASQALLTKGFDEWGVQKVSSWALIANKASIRVMEKVGLQFEKEFVFTANQLPNISAEERQAAKYALHRADFQHLIYSKP